MDTIRAFFWKIRAIFLIFKKAGEASPSPLPQLRPCYFRIKDTIFNCRFECQLGAIILYQAQFKKFKSLQKLLLGNPAIFCKIYFCKLSQTTTLCGIYFLRSMGIFAKKNWQKLIPQKLFLPKIISLKVIAQVSFSVSVLKTVQIMYS